MTLSGLLIPCSQLRTLPDLFRYRVDNPPYMGLARISLKLLHFVIYALNQKYFMRLVDSHGRLFALYNSRLIYTVK